MMVLPGLESCKLLGGEAVGGMKEVFVVGWCVCGKEGRGAFSVTGSKELHGDIDSSG